MQDLYRQLSAFIDTVAGNYLAALPDDLRASPAFMPLADELAAFGTATLRSRLDNPAAVKLLRRFVAALLPSGGPCSAGMCLIYIRYIYSKSASAVSNISGCVPYSVSI